LDHEGAGAVAAECLDQPEGVLLPQSQLSRDRLTRLSLRQEPVQEWTDLEVGVLDGAEGQR
jgi:hypothetical protein